MTTLDGHCRRCGTDLYARCVGLREVIHVDGDGEYACPEPVPCVFAHMNVIIHNTPDHLGFPEGWDFRSWIYHDGLCPCLGSIPHQLVPSPWTGPTPPVHCGRPLQYRGEHWQCRSCPAAELMVAGAA